MRPLAALFAFALATGCTDPGPYSDIAGTYAVRTVEGFPPPLQFYATSADSTVEMIGGALTLTRDATWSARWYYRTATPRVVTIDTSTAVGIYTRNGTTIAFSGPSTTPTRGTIAGDTIRVSFGLHYVYTR